MALEDELTDIHGIGDAKAADIVEVVEPHDDGGADDHVREQVETALEYIEQGQAGYAAKHLRKLL